MATPVLGTWHIMKKLHWSTLRRHGRRFARSLLAAMPGSLRFALYRRTVDCEPVTRGRLELKIAHTQDELEACFSLLHDAYVASGFMRPHPSGLRVTPYHALPTTTTCFTMEHATGYIRRMRIAIFKIYFYMAACFWYAY